MGSEQSVQASGRLVCRGGVFVSDGSSVKQVVDVKKDVTYNNVDLPSFDVMVNRDVQSAVNQFGMALSCAEKLAQPSLTQSGKTYLTDK